MHVTIQLQHPAKIEEILGGAMRTSKCNRRGLLRLVAALIMSIVLMWGLFPIPAVEGFAESIEGNEEPSAYEESTDDQAGGQDVQSGDSEDAQTVSSTDASTSATGITAQSDVTADDVASGVAAGLMAALSDVPESERLSAAFHTVADVVTIAADDGTPLNEQTIAALHGGTTTPEGAANAFTLLANHMGLKAELTYVNDWPIPRVFIAENWLSVDVATAVHARAEEGNTEAEEPWGPEQVTIQEPEVVAEEEPVAEEMSEETEIIEEAEDEERETTEANAPTPIEEDAARAEAEAKAEAESQEAESKETSATTNTANSEAGKAKGTTTTNDAKPASEPEAEEQGVLLSKPALSHNVYDCAWGVDNYLWDGARFSALHIDPSGNPERVEFVDNMLVVETLSSSMLQVNKQRVVTASNYQPTGLVKANFRWGGFFSGASHNYVVTGQDNPNCKDSLVVYRITKFDKNWNFVKALELSKSKVSGADGTAVPFSQGTVAFEEEGNLLHIRTAQEYYDGFQSSIHIVVNESNMSLADSMMYKSNQNQTTYGFVSHSFGQQLTNLNGTLYSLDLGDSYPRAVTVKKLGTTGSNSFGKPLVISGEEGDNYTGVILGGLEASASAGKVVSAFASIDQKSSERSEFGARNVYICATDAGNVTSNKVYKLTNYRVNGDKGAALVKLIKLDDAGSQLMVIWSEMNCADPWWNETNQNGKVCYAIVDGNGNRLSDIKSQNGYLSDCEPIMYNSLVSWYAEDFEGNQKPVYYTINPADCTLSSPDNKGSLNDAVILPIATQNYKSGSAVTPAVTVQYSGLTLTKDVDYKVTYSNNTNTGTATVKVTGINGYTGSKSASFIIKKAATITVSNKTIPYGSTVNLGATVTSGAGKLTYKSADSNIVKVDSTGKLTPVKMNASTKITVTAAENGTFNAASKTVTVNVTKGTPTITASNKKVKMGATVTIGASVTSGAGKLTYASKKTTVAKVDAAGKITPVAVGTATIAITSAASTNYNSATKTITVTVTKGTPTITASNKTIKMGTKVSLGAKVSAGAGKLSYTSSSTAVVKVDASGNLTPVKVGKVTITIKNAANANFSSVTKKVTVTVDKGKPTITASNKTVKLGTKPSLGAKTTSGAPKLTYKSANTSIARISSTGVITPVKAGTVKITISSASNANWLAASKTVTITVKK